ISAQEVKDHLETLRLELHEVRAAARLAALPGDSTALEAIEERALNIDNELAFLREKATDAAALPTFEEFNQSARLLVVHARSIAALRRQLPTGRALAAAAQAEELAAASTRALERSLEAQTSRINERTLVRLQVGSSLRTYVGWFVGGSIAVLAVLFVAFRRVQRREREALRKVEWLAHFDLITGLPNRALLADRLATETARARRNEQPFAVLMFDLDGFKAVNDTWGHVAGDRLLTMVAERARKCMRASDTVGRLGGDEFLAILPQTGEGGAVGVGEKLREALQAPYDLEGEEARVGASVGVALFPEHGNDPESLLRAADSALYVAKRSGKNRTRVATGNAALPRTAQTSPG
ncbi:MAG: diguanylate cyclase domain-containing protein, partial [Burkholderiales bacterium]